MTTQGLILPQRLEVDQSTLTERYGRFVADPFERGYGVTLGNSLRRILLTSIEGSSVTSIKIEGIKHEYSSIPGVMETISEKRKQGKLIEAKAAAKKLYGLDNEKAQNQIDQINKEMNKKSDKDKEKDSESDNENSEEKQKKIDFLEKSIEHAKKVMEACDQIGIPKNDPAFWGPEGVKNRVLWLKKHGLYDTYQKFNGSDPNIPKDAQTGGFRFRWMDSRGTELNGSRATDGMKYLVRYKESGYILAAIAGAFSVNWKSASSPTYTPDKYIIKVEEQLTDIKGKKVA